MACEALSAVFVIIETHSPIFIVVLTVWVVIDAVALAATIKHQRENKKWN